MPSDGSELINRLLEQKQEPSTRAICDDLKTKLELGFFLCCLAERLSSPAEQEVAEELFE